MVAQVTFRSDNVFTDRFGRELADTAQVGDTLDMWQRFEVERYLEYHGTKLAKRFDTNSYLAISKAMDLHDVARGRGALEHAMAPVQRRRRWPSASRATCCTPPTSSARSPTLMRRLGRRQRDYFEIDSPHGHDAFLINGDQLAGPLERFLGDIPL